MSPWPLIAPNEPCNEFQAARQSIRPASRLLAFFRSHLWLEIAHAADEVPTSVRQITNGVFLPSIIIPLIRRVTIALPM